MAVLTVRVTERLERRLRQYAEASGRTMSAVVRSALEEHLHQPGETSGRPSAFDLMRDHIGTIDGPSDLATNPAHMTEYGK